jgi:hypothetical protein
MATFWMITTFLGLASVGVPVCAAMGIVTLPPENVLLS